MKTDENLAYDIATACNMKADDEGDWHGVLGGYDVVYNYEDEFWKVYKFGTVEPLADFAEQHEALEDVAKRMNVDIRHIIKARRSRVEIVYRAINAYKNTVPMSGLHDIVLAKFGAALADAYLADAEME